MSHNIQAKLDFKDENRTLASPEISFQEKVDGLWQWKMGFRSFTGHQAAAEERAVASCGGS